ncbi:MAG: hypothetical protein ACK53R_06450 [Bacteroidota bacterium]
MFKYTTTTLAKIEDLMKEAAYNVRYEKGNFKAGYCLLKDKRIVVINKFFNTESRINSFLDIIPTLDINDGSLSEKNIQFLKYLKEANRNN